MDFKVPENHRWREVFQLLCGGASMPPGRKAIADNYLPAAKAKCDERTTEEPRPCSYLCASADGSTDINNKSVIKFILAGPYLLC